jgi:hypothetical protein
MNTQMSYGRGVVTSINPTKFGAQSTDTFRSAFRPFQWARPEGDENHQRLENDGALGALLELISTQYREKDFVDPVIWWRIDNTLDLNTHLAVAMSNSDTYIRLASANQIHAGYTLFVPSTGEQLHVVDVDVSLGEGWTNGAGAACNVRVNRTFYNGPSLAGAINAEVWIGAPRMGELGEPKEGIHKIPGDPMCNYVQLFGIFTSISNFQKNSMMASGYGTLPKQIADNEMAMKVFVQQQLLWSHKGTQDTAEEGMVYTCNGLIPQLKDNIMDFGTEGNTFTYGNASEYIDGLFESRNSGSTRVIPVGERLFMNWVNTARQEGAMAEGITFNPQIGVDEFKFQTYGGKTVTVMNMRRVFEGEMKDFGLVLDPANVGYGEYTGFKWGWYEDMENPMQAITKRTDALVGSMCPIIIDPSTCGLIRGGVEPLVANRTGLGVVDKF